MVRGGFPCFPLKCPVGREWNRAGEYGRGVAKEQIKGYREVRLAGWIVERGGAHGTPPLLTEALALLGVFLGRSDFLYEGFQLL